MIANPLIGSLWTGSRRDAGHLDYCQQLLTIRGNSRALYLWTERPIAPSFQQKSESFQSTDCDCSQSTDNLGVFHRGCDCLTDPLRCSTEARMAVVLPKFQSVTFPNSRRR
jgi:hypothetical protein